MKHLQIIKSIFVFSLFVVLLSCGSSGSNGSSSDSAKGRVSLLITDGPTTDFDQINITLESISFISDEDEDGDVEGSDDNGKEVIVFDESKVINLLALQNYSDLLTTTLIPTGTYSKIRLHVSQVELVKLNEDGTVKSSVLAKLPSNGKIDLNPRGSFEIVADGNLMIELDVDAEKSIHIVKTGSRKYIFRPVIFVNILGEEDLKLVILTGKVFEATGSAFQLCKEESLEVNDNCIEVNVTEATVVQNSQINAVDKNSIDNENIVTVLGKASSKNVNALHVVIAAVNGEDELALFNGKSDSAVSVSSVFDMTTGDDNDVVLPETSLSVLIANSARIFDEHGNQLSAASILDGSDVDVFGLALPNLLTVNNVRAAFVIVDNDVEDDKISGNLVAVNVGEEEITVFVVNGSFSGDVCVKVDEADIFLLSTSGDSISSKEIAIDELELGMIVDVYGDDDDGCMSADVVLVSES